MKRLFLGSLLCCMFFGRLFAAAQPAVIAQPLSLQQQSARALLDKEIRALGGKVMPTYIQTGPRRFTASDEDVCFRQEFIDCIQEAMSRAIHALQERAPYLINALRPLIEQRKQELEDIWRANWRHADDGSGYEFQDVYVLESVARSDIAQYVCDQNTEHNRRDLLLYNWEDRYSAEYLSRHGTAIKNAIDLAVQDPQLNPNVSAYRQFILERVAFTMKEKIDRATRAYPIIMHRDNIMQSAFFLTGAYYLYVKGGEEELPSLRSWMHDPEMTNQFQLRSGMAFLAHLKVAKKMIGTVRFDDEGGLIDTVGHALAGSALGLLAAVGVKSVTDMGFCSMMLSGMAARALLEKVIPSLYKSMVL